VTAVKVTAPILLLLACSGSLPARYVIERDLEEFSYRRYQKVLDTEIVVEGNDAVGHTATYLRRDRGKTVAFATAFVTVYTKAGSLSAEVRERLKTLESYEFSTRDLGAGFAWILDGGDGERWAIWVNGKYMVKIGAPAGEGFPQTVLDAYMDVYPSDLTEHGHARQDAQSAGASRERQEEEGELDIPRHLREGAPR
jgi:hypothetical protein